MVEQGEPRDAADIAFERLLLSSAQADVVPEQAAKAAWSKFASGAGALAAGMHAPTGSEPASSLLHERTRAALQWLAIGALGGGLLAAAWLVNRQAAGIVPSLVSVPSTSRVVLAPPPAPATSEAPLAPSAAPAAAPSSARPRSLSPPGARGSTLAAEVMALDAVRTAIAIGAPAEALRLVDEYRRKFPQGQLATEAEVLAIEAFAQQGNEREVKRLAARFLGLHPQDPQAARVRSLSAR
jgi:hypothetical protein